MTLLRGEKLKSSFTNDNSRAVLDAKFYLESRISPSLIAGISFNVMEADSNHLPSWLNFKHYPQVLLLPAESSSAGDSKERLDI